MLYLFIIYLILNNLTFFNKYKLSKLYIATKFQLLCSIIIFIGFFCYFIIFIRLMNFFRENRFIDLKYYLSTYDIKLIILTIVLILVIRNNFFFITKMNCYKLHYYFMNNDISSNILKPYYNRIFNDNFNSLVYYTYPYMYYINIMITTICYIFIMCDIIFNNFILNNSLVILSIYSLFKFMYNFVCYFEFKYNPLMEYLVRRFNYMILKKNENVINDIIYDFPENAEYFIKIYETEVIRKL